MNLHNFRLNMEFYIKFAVLQAVGIQSNEFLIFSFFLYSKYR